MKLRLIVGLVAAIILIVAGMVINDLYRATEHEVANRFLTHQTLIVRHLAQDIEHILRTQSKTIQTLSGLASIQHRDPQKMKSDIREGFRYMKDYQVQAMSVYDAKGAIVYSTTKEVAGINHLHSDFFQWAARKENKGKVSIFLLMPAAVIPVGQPLHCDLLLVTPVYQEASDPRYGTPSHEFAGVLSAVIGLEQIIGESFPRFTTDLTPEQVWIIDTLGSVISHPQHPEMVTRNVHHRDESCMQCHTTFDYVDYILAKRKGTIEYALKEQPAMMATFAPLRCENATWIIVVNLPLDVISGFLERQRLLSLLLVGIVLLVLVVASALFYRGSRLKIRAEEEAKQWLEKRELWSRICESEERFNQVMENSEEWVWETDAHGLYIYSSSAVQAILGYHPQEIVGKKHFYELFVPDVAGQLQQAVLAAIAQKQIVCRAVNPIVHKNGSTIVVETSCSPILDQGGDLQGYRGTHTDITGRQQTEDALKQSLSLLQATLESTADGILVVDRSGKITSHNREFAKMWGLPEDIVAARDDDRALNHVQVQLKDPKTFISKVRDLYAHPDESSFDVLELMDGRVFERYSQPQRVDGKPLGRVWSFRDVTERTRAEKAVFASELELRRVWESSFDGMRVADEQGTILMVNEAYCTMVGKRREELVGKPLTIVAAKSQEWQALEKHRRRFSLGTIESLAEKELELWDGREIWFEVSSSFFEIQGRPKMVLSVFRDITERKRAAQERESLIKELKTALENVKTLDGLVPICAHCKKIRDDQGYWNQLEKYIVEHTDAQLTHGICPDCVGLYFPGLAAKIS